MPTGINVSKETVQEIAKLTVEGLNAQEIAMRLGLHVATVLHHRPAEMRRFKATPEDVQKWFEFYSQGWSVAETGREFGVTAQTIRNAFRKAGFSTRETASAKSRLVCAALGSTT